MWSSRGTTLAYTVLCHLSVRVHDYWYSNFFTATNCLQPFSINISPLVLPTCRRMWSIALFQPSGFWLVTRNMSHRARLAHCSGMVTSDDRQKNTWSNRTNHVAECTNICQPRARDQQSIHIAQGSLVDWHCQLFRHKSIKAGSHANRYPAAAEFCFDFFKSEFVEYSWALELDAIINGW